MGRKYIIEIGRLERLYKAFIGAHGKPEITWLSPEVDLTPYTEPNMEQVRKEAYDKAFEDAEQVAESGKRAMYQKGLSDAWDTARKICAMDSRSRDEIFGTVITTNIIDYNSASKALEEIRAHEQAQKEKEEQIQVGDEVVGTYTGEEETEPFVIIRKIPEIYPNYYFGIYSKSGEFCQGGLKLKKTGRHFPEIAEVMQKMKE